VVSDLAPDIECRCRYRAADVGLIAYTRYPAATKAATHGPRSVSIPTTTLPAASAGSRSAQLAGTCRPRSSWNATIPTSPSGSRFFASTLPDSSWTSMS